MKFAMGAETLTVLTKQTSSANDDLGSLVKQLFAAAEPIQGKFNGAGRAAFDRFKGETDQIANELNSALAAVAVDDGLQAPHHLIAPASAEGPRTATP